MTMEAVPEGYRVRGVTPHAWAGSPTRSAAGINQCNATTQNQQSMCNTMVRLALLIRSSLVNCMTKVVNSIDDFCLFVVMFRCRARV
jgi:hypothetical protein